MGMFRSSDSRRITLLAASWEQVLQVHALRVLHFLHFAFTMVLKPIQRYILILLILFGPRYTTGINITCEFIFNVSSKLKTVVNTTLLAKQCAVLMTVLKSTSTSYLKIVAASFLHYYAPP